MRSRRTLETMAACLLASAPLAGAGSDNDSASALLNQVRQLATSGQDSKTTGEVNQFIDDNRGSLMALLTACTNYLKQFQQQQSSDEGNYDSASTSEASPQVIPAVDTQTVTSSPEATEESQPSAPAIPQRQQDRDELRSGHLAGYPSLADAAPASSVINPTAGQLAYAAKVQQEMQDRKQYLMEHPEGYTY